MADGPKITQGQLDAAAELNQRLKDGEISAKDYASALKEAGLELANQINLIDKKIQKLIEINQLQGENEDITNRIIEQEEERNRLTEEGAAADAEAAKERIKQNRALKEFNKELAQSNVWGKQFLSNMAAGVPIMEQLQNAAANIAYELGSDALIGLTAALTNGFAKADQLTTEFNQLTGTAGAMNDVILNSAQGMSAVGVSTEMAAKSAGELYQQFNQFSSANANLQKDMVQTAASLERLGVSSATTAKNIDLASNAFGMGVEQATQLQDDLAKTAMAIGMPPAQLAQEFGKAAPQLSAYGKEGIQVFKNMAAASKGLGIEMGTLLGLTEKFDTFEGAAESAGRLNAMLGGDLLNSMDLLNATEDERIRMILQSVDASGKSWQSMGKFEKKALANAAGITDMAEANKLFGGGLAAFDDAQAKMAENAKTEEELAAAKAASVSVTEKLSLLMDRFTAAMAPVVNVVHFFLDGILALNDALGGWLVPVILGGVAALFAMYKVIQFVAFAQRAWAVGQAVLAGSTSVLGAAQSLQSGAQAGVAATAPAAAGGTQLMGIAAFAAAPGVAALALGVGLLALGIGLLGIAIAGIVWAFVYLMKLFIDSPKAALQASGALAIMGLALAGLTVVFAALAPIAPFAMSAMIMLGIGMMFLAVPMLVLAASMYVLSAAFKLGGLDPASLAALGLSLLAFSLTLLAAAPAMLLAALFFAPAALLIVFGLLTLGAGVSMIIKSASQLPTLGLGLVALAFLLHLAAPTMMLAALLFAPAAILVGIGLTLLGVGVSLLVEYGRSLPTLGAGLALFALGLLGAAFPMFLAATYFAPAAMLLGAGLLMLGLGIGQIVEYRRSMKTLGKNLPEFALALVVAAPALATAGVLMGIAGVPFLLGAIMLSLGLMVLTIIPSKTIMQTSQELAQAAPSLITAAQGLSVAAPGLFIAGVLLGLAGPLLLVGSIMLLAGMFVLSLVPAQEVLIVGSMLALAAPLLIVAAVGLIIAAPLLAIAAFGLMLAAPLIAMAGIGLMFASVPFIMGALGLLLGTSIFALIPAAQVLFVSQQLALAAPLMMTAALGLLFASPILLIGAFWFLMASAVLLVAAPAFFIAGLFLSMGMALVNEPLRQFAITMLMLAPIVPQMYAMAGALAILGLALPIFGFGLFMLGLLSAIPFVKTGLNVLATALYIFADAMSTIPVEKAVALGQIFGGLTVLTEFKGVGEALRELAMGIWVLGWAMDAMPEEKLVTMGVAMESMAPLGEIAQNMTPEVAVAAGSLVDEAERYVEVQAKMKSTKDDAFAQMVTASAKATQARAEADKAAAEQGGGQDVVLVLNERELGRAVEAILNKRVNLSIT